MQDYPSLEDTQPKSPLKTAAEPRRLVLPPDAAPSGGPGCATWGCIGLIGLALSVAIVFLAAAAGWTSGRREADVHATATQGAAISEQLNRIPNDIASGNLLLADTRLRFLATLTPGVPGVSELAATATAMYLTRLPTATPTVTPTPEPLEVTEEADDLVITPAGDSYDLAALLDEAQRAVNTGQFADAYEVLDVIIAVDPNYERAAVRDLMTQALNGQARAMFSANNPAQGIVWATRAEALGVLQGDMSYELFAAVQWQNAQAALSVSFPRAIEALWEIINMGEGGRYYQDARQLLFEQYWKYGDALANDPNAGFCPAVQQYANALEILSSTEVSQKRSNAASMCAQATPTPDPNATLTPPAPDGAPTESPPPA